MREQPELYIECETAEQVGRALAQDHAVATSKEVAVECGAPPPGTADLEDAPNPLKEIRATPLAITYGRGRSRIVEFLISHRAEEFDPEAKTSFELEATLKAAEIKWSERRLLLRRDDDLQREYRIEVSAKMSLYGRAPREIGRLDVAASMQESSSRLIEAIENTPAEPGMSISDYREQVQARVEEEGWEVSRR